MAASKPTWHREAIRRDIDFIAVVYEKAEGFVFCPTNLEKPFRVGGDYDGSMACDAEGALWYLGHHFNTYFLDRVEWFVPFLHKVVHGDDFSLNDLRLDERPHVRIISGRWPW